MTVSGDHEYVRRALEEANARLLAEMAERRQVQVELEKANAELTAHSLRVEEANRAKSRFLASVSHELRTPLHTLLGFVRLARRDADGEVRSRLVVAERSGSQLLKLIDDLLEFNRGEGQPRELHAEPVALRDILAQIERAGSLMAAEGDNAYVMVTEDDLPDAVAVDERRLLQVLHNLVGNACKYTRGGTVRVRIERDGGKTMADGLCRLRFAVEDSGTGIAAEEQEHVFDAFARGTSSRGQPGLGLGLAIAQQWVRAMGGEIRVRSAPGQGSRFFFALTLPLAAADVAARAHDAETEPATPKRAGALRTVLVADDIAENRLLLRDLCERWGFAVVEAADGDDALQACLDAMPPVDVAVVDQFMPRMGGWEFLRRIRAMPSLRRLPTVLISASTAQEPADFPPGLDFDLVLDKPLDEDVLADFLCGRLAGEASPDRESDRGTALPGALSCEETQRFRTMVDLGRVEAIAAWAQGLAAADPAHAAFAERVVRLCRAADLAALEKIAEAAI